MASLPITPDVINTPRLRLVRLTDATPGSEHVQWFHENWSDPVITGWRYRPHIPHPSSYATTTHPIPMLLALKHQSLHGATKSLEESRLRMIEHMEGWDTWFYAVFDAGGVEDAEDAPKANVSIDPSNPVSSSGRGRHLGSVSLRLAPVGLELPPPSSEALKTAPAVGTGEALSSEEVKGREEQLEGLDLQVRTLGYAFFAHAQGKGYATETCKGLLDGYAHSIKEWRASYERRNDEGLESTAAKQGPSGTLRDESKVVFYIEAGVDQENPGSQKVLQKLGFRTVGLKVEKEKAWLNGAWRGPGWWITGKYL